VNFCIKLVEKVQTNSVQYDVTISSYFTPYFQCGFKIFFDASVSMILAATRGDEKKK